MRKLMKLLVCVTVLVFLFTGCSGNNNSNNTEDIGVTVASVGGEKISMADLDKRVQQVATMYQYDVEGPENKDMSDYLKTQVLESLIYEILITKEAEKQNIEVIAEDLESELKTIKDQFDTEESYEQFLNERKMTKEELESYVKNQLLLNKIFDMVTKDITSSSVKPEEYYENNQEEFYSAEQRQARHILLATKEEAMAVIERIDNGEDFAELAVELSLDTSAEVNKGLIDYFTKDNTQLVREFVDGAFTVNIGEYTKEPVQTMFGFHVIKIEDIKPSKQYAFDEVKDMLSEKLLMEDKQNKFNEYIEQIRSEVEIVNNLEELLKAEDQQSAETSAQTQDSEDAAETNEGNEVSK